MRENDLRHRRGVLFYCEASQKGMGKVVEFLITIIGVIVVLAIRSLIEWLESKPSSDQHKNPTNIPSGTSSTWQSPPPRVEQKPAQNAQHVAPHLPDASVWDGRIWRIVEEVGIRERVDSTRIRDLVEDGMIHQAAEAIAKCLGLPIKINLVLKNESPDTKLAYVSVPSDLPQYGMPALMNFPITVTTYRKSHANPDRFICVMAHELCHILLHSHRYALADREDDTDIAVLLFGFAQNYKIGKNIIHFSADGQTTESAGYLTQEQFDYVYAQYDHILAEKKRERAERLGRMENLIAKQHDVDRGIAKRFNRALRLIVAHKPNISTEDTPEIMRLMSTYKDGVDEASSEELGTEVEEAIAVLRKGNFYDKLYYRELEECENKILVMKNRSQHAPGASDIPTEEDVALLEKYTEKWVDRF